MPRRTLVDPRFGGRLREIRQARGLSLAALARVAYVGKSGLSELENGIKRPSVEMAAHLDQVLNAAGELAGYVTAPSTAADPEGAERIGHALAAPGRLDPGAVDALAGVLAAQRRLDDTLPAEVMIPWADPQWRIVQRLADDARGRHAPPLHRVVAEWTQFLGWLHAEARQDAQAVRLLDRARAEAVELGDGPLVAQAADFRAYLARLRREWRQAARWSLTAAGTSGATGLQQAQNLAHAAYALARVGERREALRLLGRARDLTDADEPPLDTVYWLSPGFIRLGIGLALLGAGDRPGAAEQLAAGLAGLPAGWADAEWASEYRQALTDATQ